MNLGKKVSLGFTTKKFEEGIHICQIYNNDKERHETLIDFIISGFQSNEKTKCITEKESENELSVYFSDHGFNFSDLVEKGIFSISKTTEVYFEGNKFDPDKMIQLLVQFFDSAKKENLNGARIIGEMTPEVEKIEGGSRLIEYEAKVSLLVNKFPINAVCQYDARKFDGSTILNILKVHPYLIVNQNVVSNPFYEKPEEFLSKN